MRRAFAGLQLHCDLFSLAIELLGQVCSADCSLDYTIIGGCVFQQRWKTDKQYKTWIAPNAKHKNKLVCKLCQKAIYLTRMGESALTSHMKGAKHRELLAESSLDSFITVTNVTRAEQPTELSTVVTGDSSEPLQAGPSSRAPSIQPIQGTTCTILSVAHNADLKAEILWALNFVVKNYSFMRCKGVSEIFVLCFQIVRLQSSFTVESRKQIILPAKPAVWQREEDERLCSAI